MATAESTTIDTSTTTLSAASQAVVTGADSQAASAISTLGLVQQARLSSQNRAAIAAVAAFGKDSTQAAAATQAVAITQASSARLAVLGQKVNTPQPAVSATGWALHGRVYDANLNPQTSYTVFFVDAQKNYLSQYGFAYTDSTGYFLINYSGVPAGAVAQPGTPAGAGSQASATPPAAENPSAAATGTPPPSETTTTTSTGPQLYLQLADANGNPVLLSEIIFTPTTGQATYQVVTLPTGAAKLGDPPAAVRAVAMPPAQAATTKSQATTTKAAKGKPTTSSSSS